MEELESHVEHSHETIHEHSHGSKDRWVTFVALTAALMSALAAFSSSMSSHHESEGIRDRIKASDQWAYYQAGSIKRQFALQRMDHFEDMGKPVPPVLLDNLKKHDEKSAGIQEEAKAEEKSSEDHMRLHGFYGHSVMFYQMAIAMSAIALVVRRKAFWAVGIAFGVVGICCMLQAFIP